jgi:ABC-type antimicrobial peptide transport system permease subunit
VAITLTLQFNLFTELTFTFSFPTALFLSVVAMSAAVAVIGSYAPARNVTKREIALVIRGM